MATPFNVLPIKRSYLSINVPFSLYKGLRVILQHQQRQLDPQCAQKTSPRYGTSEQQNHDLFFFLYTTNFIPRYLSPDSTYYIISSTNKLHLSVSISHNAKSNRRQGLRTKHFLNTQLLDLWPSFSDCKSCTSSMYYAYHTMLLWPEIVGSHC